MKRITSKIADKINIKCGGTNTRIVSSFFEDPKRAPCFSPVFLNGPPSKQVEPQFELTTAVVGVTVSVRRKDVFQNPGPDEREGEASVDPRRRP